MIIPAGRTESILSEVVGDELLLYDSTTTTVYCLNPLLGRIYRACCHRRDDLADLTPDQVRVGLGELAERGLLQPQKEPVDFSRRELLRRLSLAGLSIPAVSSALVPAASAAASFPCDCAAPAGANARPQGCPCSSNNDCCGVCLGGTLTCSATTGPSLPTAAPCCPPPVVGKYDSSSEIRLEDTTGPWPETSSRP